jgi:hypothetical protein
MKVKTVIEKEDGIYEFTAELQPDQHAFLIEYAVKDLMLRGLLPFTTASPDNIATVAPGSTDGTPS